MDGIRLERNLLEEIKGRAHQIIDTSQLKPAQLKEKIVSRFARTDQNRLAITFQSFGFKYGIPIDADLVSLIVRFLPNPHYVESLKPRTGLYGCVRLCDEMGGDRKFLEKMTDMLSFLLPHYQREGKTSLVVGIGCTRR